MEEVILLNIPFLLFGMQLIASRLTRGCSPLSSTTNKKIEQRVITFPDDGILSFSKVKFGDNDEDFALLRDSNGDIMSIASSRAASCIIPYSSQLLNHSTAFVHIINVINSATRSIDVSMYMFTSNEIKNAILFAKGRGVKIRLLVDSRMSRSSGSQIAALRKNQIPIVYSYPPSMTMHNKFVLIDAYECKSKGLNVFPNNKYTKRDCECQNQSHLMMGSFNWTWGAVILNYESVIITNDPCLIHAYRDIFERLWHQFKRHTFNNKYDA